MNFQFCFLLPALLPTYLSVIGQTSIARSKIDSSFTLTKQLQKDKSFIRKHGVFFNEKPKQVLKDLNYFATLSSTDLKNYKREVINENNHTIKIWRTNNAYKNVLQIIEINSIYFIDTTDNEGNKFKDTIFYSDYFIQLKDTSKNISYETIKGQGVNKYSIGNREVWTHRETIMVGLFYVDNEKEIEKLLNKYNYAQQAGLRKRG